MRFAKAGFVASVIALNLSIVTSGLVLTGTGPFEVNPRIAPISQAAIDFKPKEKIVGAPVRIVIKGADLDLVVKPGKFNPSTEEWTLNNQDAFFAEQTSPISNIIGNTLIYGHNIPQVFTKLHELEKGAELVVFTDTGAQFSYTLVSSEEVLPSNTQILYQQTKPQVTLQTCTGNWNEYRRLFTFTLTERSLS